MVTIRHAVIVAFALLAASGNGSAQSSTAPASAPVPPDPPAGTLRIELRATPGTEVRVADLANWALYVRITNVGTRVIDTRVDGSELTVNGRSAGMQWALAIGNGPRDGRFGALPPGQSTETGRAMQGSLFHGAGVYALQLRIGGNVSVPLIVRVRP